MHPPSLLVSHLHMIRFILHGHSFHGYFLHAYFLQQHCHSALQNPAVLNAPLTE